MTMELRHLEKLFLFISTSFLLHMIQPTSPWALALTPYVQMRTIAFRGPDFREGVSCPSATENGQFDHPKFCDKYLNCWEGQLVIGSCPSGLVFNQKNSACDYPQNVDCNGRGDSRPSVVSSSMCPSPYGTFPSATNCSQFIVCQGGNATVYSCAPDLYYNSALGVCTYKEEADCVQISQPAGSGPENELMMTTTTTTSPENGPSPSVPVIINPQQPPPQRPEESEKPDPSIPSAQPTIDPGTVQQPQAPNPNPPTDTSEAPLPSDVDQILWPSWPNWPTQRCPVIQGFLPVAGDCEAVVVCIGGFGHYLRCPAGHAFDLTIGKCGPIRMQQGCEQQHYPPEGDDTAQGVKYVRPSTMMNKQVRFNGAIKYVYLPLNVAVLPQKQTNNNPIVNWK